MSTLFITLRDCTTLLNMRTSNNQSTVAQTCSIFEKKFVKYSPATHHHLSKLIEHAIINWRNEPTPNLPTFLHTRFHTLFDAQSKIGWHHICKGRFSIKWLSCISPNQNFARRWLTYVIIHIWNLWYEVWKYRCDTNKGDNPTTKDI
jgi:hypothetical protein